MAKTLAKLLLTLVAIQALALARLPNILNLPWLGDVLGFAWTGELLLSGALLLIFRPGLGIASSVCFLLILSQSYASLYQPSLSSEIPRLDYIFFRTVSSNYCFDIASRYLSNVATPFFAFAGAFAVFKGDLESLLTYIFKLLFGLLLLNVVVVSVQGIHDIHFLAAGSGSSVDVHRAAGLLEDSGASTIALSSLLFAFFVIGTREGIDKRWRRPLMIFLLLAMLLGSFTGGRSYFTLLGLGCATYGAFLVASRRSLWKWGMAFAALFAVVVALVARQPFAQGSDYARSFINDNVLMRILGYLDPLRAAHIGIFAKAIPEYWPQGLGLGASHIALAQYGGLYEARGVPIAGDAPLNYFLAFILELGIAGPLLLLALGLKTWRVVCSGRLRSSLLLPSLLLGACVGVSFAFGSQFNQRSLAVLFVLPLALVVGLEPQRGWRARLPFALAGLALFWTCVDRYVNRPLVPQFFWARQGHPQIPNPPNVPIAKPEGSVWMQSGIPFAVEQRSTGIFVELPPQFYPQRLKVEVFEYPGLDRVFKTQLAIESYDSAKPGHTFQVELPEKTFLRCSEAFQPQRFCFMIVNNNPVWNLSPHANIGFSLLRDRKIW